MAIFHLGMELHACNSSTREAEAVGSQVGGQPELHNETPSWGKKKKKSFSPQLLSACASLGIISSGANRFIPGDSGKQLKQREWKAAGVLKFSSDIVQTFLQHRNSTKNSSAVFVSRGCFFKLFDVREGML
jgi:hypothetical protein